ncbi:hypothetical protein F0L68_24065 [Solihabitans fulvus]|uniref:Uncharacterized protein n=1 Tax=Solihabitans fulvus TaxID=1892852 RepID=A0A5B2X4M0_9PSEU|nr:hypothetical protein [Solihabitans fulvus]KAA2258061.1 hypothetical protein F0L68_24065 [Solihabitans fulvus]
MARTSLPPELAEALRLGPFDLALRLAIRHRGLSLARVRAHLRGLGTDLGQSTLSYWQRGLRRPEAAGDTVRALETVLRLPPNSLVALVEAGPSPRQEFAGVYPKWERHAELMPKFDLDPTHRPNQELQVVAVHDFVEFGRDREQRRQTTRMVVSALRSGPDRYFAVFVGDDGCRIEDVAVRTGEGCRVGRVRHLPADGMLAAELLFDRRLVVGETHVFRFCVAGGAGGPSTGVTRSFARPVGSYLAQLEFHRRAVPARCTRQFLAAQAREPMGREDLQCCLGLVASAYFADLGAGTAQIGFEWS